MRWSVTTAQEGTRQIVDYLNNLGESKHAILLLVSGGSAINVEAEVLTQLKKSSHILGVLPMDERFGPTGHADSNIAQLNKSLDNDSSVPVHDVLGQNLPFNETVGQYSSLAQDLFARADHIVGIFGIGPDGHTAGILPDSPATNDTVSTVIGYNWQDYERMTLGTLTLLQIDQAFVLAYGENKKEPLERLQTNEEPFEKLPAKLLYDIANVTVYNDYINSEG